MSCLVVSPAAGCNVVAMNRSFKSLISLVNFFARLAAVHNSVEDDVAHTLGERFGVAIDARVVPGVNPVDHAEQAHHRGASVEIEAALTAQVFHQPEADAVVFALDTSNLRAQAVLKRLIFVRKDLQSLLIAHEVFEVIQDKDADTVLGFDYVVEALFQSFEDRGEGVFLNQKK